MGALAEKDKKKLPTKYQVIADTIPVGSNRAIKLDDIMIIADIKNKRDAYLIIENLITKYGYPIAGSKTGRKGYFYPSNQRELEQATHTLKNSYESLKKRHDALKSNYKKYVRN